MRKTPDSTYRAVLRAIATGRHPSLVQIHRTATAKVAVSQAQVRRIVNQLVKLHLVQFREVNGEARYQLGTMPSPVTICLKCWTIKELDIDDRYGPLYLPQADGRLPMQLQIEDNQFQVISWRFDFYGYCGLHRMDMEARNRRNRLNHWSTLDSSGSGEFPVIFSQRYFGVDMSKVRQRDMLVDKILAEKWLSDFEGTTFMTDYQRAQQASLAYLESQRPDFLEAPTDVHGNPMPNNSSRPLPEHWRKTEARKATAKKRRPRSKS